MIEIYILSIALSMDAFAVSVGLGSKRVKNTGELAVFAALYFGIFQAAMPIIGFFGGKGVLGWFEAYMHWIAFSLLLLVGLKMIYDALREGIEEDITQITHKIMLILAIATSIDAMAAGFTLHLIEVNPLLACCIIGATSFLFSLLGVYVGAKSGTWLESKAEILGGTILILIGFKILIF